MNTEINVIAEKVISDLVAKVKSQVSERIENLDIRTIKQTDFWSLEFRWGTKNVYASDRRHLGIDRRFDVADIIDLQNNPFQRDRIASQMIDDILRNDSLHA